jgi:hypothetical protein
MCSSNGLLLSAYLIIISYYRFFIVCQYDSEVYLYFSLTSASSSSSHILLFCLLVQAVWSSLGLDLF